MHNDHNGYHYCSNLCPQFWIYTAAAAIIIILCVYIVQCRNYACFCGMHDYRLPKSRIVNRSNTMDMPVRNNQSYVTALSQQSTTNTSGAAPKDQTPKAGSADATIINQGEAHHDGPEYSCLGPQYETIDSSRRESQSQKNQKARSSAAAGGSILARGSYPFGPDSSPIWLDNVRCSGTEASLFDCPANAIGDSNCDHDEDIGVQCTAGG